MKIAVGSDHAGYYIKNQLRDMLRSSGHEVIDFGADNDQSSDYPDYAELVSGAVLRNDVERGVLVCGTGVGMSIAANKIHGIRAASCSEPVSATLSRSHNDANVVCLGERIVGPEMANEIVRAFIATPFSNSDRHRRRIEKISGLDK